MSVTYFKRFRMAFDLTGSFFPVPDIPPGYRFFAWQDNLLSAHADAKFRSFQFELDANVFPCLGQPDGCRRLMNEITGRNGFVEEATWLLGWQPRVKGEVEYCGTVQGIRDQKGGGSIQNLGITPEHRGQGLGTALLYYALQGFRKAGLKRASLEVTAQNYGAVTLYRRLGFRKTKTVYKAVEVAVV